MIVDIYLQTMVVELTNNRQELLTNDLMFVSRVLWGRNPSRRPFGLS